MSSSLEAAERTPMEMDLDGDGHQFPTASAFERLTFGKTHDTARPLHLQSKSQPMQQQQQQQRQQRQQQQQLKQSSFNDDEVSFIVDALGSSELRFDLLQPSPPDGRLAWALELGGSGRSLVLHDEAAPEAAPQDGASPANMESAGPKRPGLLDSQSKPHSSAASSFATASSAGSAMDQPPARPGLAEGRLEHKRKSGEFLRMLSGSGRSLTKASGFTRPDVKKRRSEPTPAPEQNPAGQRSSSAPARGYALPRPLAFLKGKNKKPWKRQEELMILHVVYYFVDKDLKTISEMVQCCDVSRSTRAIDKKLKRLLNFEKWNMRVQSDIQARIRELCSVSPIALTPEQRTKLESIKRAYNAVNFPPIPASAAELALS